MSRRLWNPNLGIRFSSTPEPKAVVYPVLNVSNYVDSSIIGDEHLPKIPEGKQKHGAISDSIDGLENANLPKSLDPPEHCGNTPLVVESQSEEAVKETAATKIVDPPSSSLSYQISSDLFSKAREAKPGSPGSFWSHTMYQSIKADGTKANVKVHYCRSKHTMETTCKQYFLGKTVLGCDLEWQPWATKTAGVRSNVSLIQIASESHIGLFHVALFPKDDFVAPSFRKIMEDPNVSKAGVNIRGDCTRLKKFLGVETRGIFELSHLYKVVKYSQELHPPKLNKYPVALATQVEEFLHLPLFKGDLVRSSDWSFALNEHQIKYSASDAYAAVQLYHVMEKQRLQLDPTPPRPYHAELDLPLQLAVKVEKVQSEEEVATASASEIAEQDTVDGELALAGEAVKGPETRVSESAKASSPSSASRSAPQKRSSPVPQIDSRLQAAELRLNQYRRSKPTAVQVGPSFLRAYYIWYDNESLNPEKIAQIMRDPPLKLNTVTGYIIGAVSTEGLPYNIERMRKEVISTLHPDILQSGKYQRVVDACKITTSDQ